MYCYLRLLQLLMLPVESIASSSDLASLKMVIVQQHLIIFARKSTTLLP